MLREVGRQLQLLGHLKDCVGMFILSLYPQAGFSCEPKAQSNSLVLDAFQYTLSSSFLLLILRAGVLVFTASTNDMGCY